MQALHKICITIALIFGFSSSVLAQSGCPSIVTGAILTAGQWNACFAAKQNTLNFIPLNASGGVMTGPLITAPSITGAAGFNITPGVAPSSPNNGDMWITSTLFSVQIGGVTSNVLLSSNNLSDLANAATARTNLGLGTFAIANTATPPAIGGTTPAAGSFSSVTDTGILGSTQCLQVNSSGVISGTGGVCGGSGSNPLLTGTVLAKTTTYSAVTGDCGDSITLGGSAQYTLTLNAASGYAANCGFLVTNLVSETVTKTIAPNGLTAFFLYPGQSVIISNQSNAWNVGPIAGRWRLAGAVTVYVRPDGSDSNDGLANSSGGAFLTANAAIAAIASNVDINNRTDLLIFHTCASPPCTITAPAQLVQMVTGIQFIGGVPTYAGTTNCTSLTNATTLAPSSATNQADIQVTYAPSALNVCGFILAGGANVSFGLYVSGGATVRITGIMNWSTVSGVGNAQIVSASTGKIFVLNNYTISGNATAHYYAYHQGQIEMANGLTITCSGSPVYTDFALTASLGELTHAGATFTSCGTVTGARYSAQANSVIDTGSGGASYFPGNSSGTTSTGGIYE